jgi:hypothetical protein
MAHWPVSGEGPVDDMLRSVEDPEGGWGQFTLLPGLQLQTGASPGLS